MILLRKPKPKILYLHGKDEETKYPGGGVIYNTLKKYLDIDYSGYSSDPEEGWRDFENIDFSKYDAVIGFSMGGAYSSCQTRVPAILINPGYGLSRKFPEYKKLDNAWKKTDHKNIIKIFLGDSDKYALDGIFPEIQKAGLEDKVQWFPSKHVPTEEQIKKYLIPNIKKLI